MLKIALDGFAGMKIRSFSFSASLIGAQLKERDASDYEFIAATMPNVLCQKKNEKHFDI